MTEKTTTAQQLTQNQFFYGFFEDIFPNFPNSSDFNYNLTLTQSTGQTSPIVPHADIAPIVNVSTTSNIFFVLGLIYAYIFF